MSIYAIILIYIILIKMYLLIDKILNKIYYILTIVYYINGGTDEKTCFKCC